MKEYIGVKVIKAEPLLQKQFTNNELTEHIMAEGYKVVYEDGYESWSPKSVFEKAYLEIVDIEKGVPLHHPGEKDGKDSYSKVDIYNQAIELQYNCRYLENFLKYSYDRPGVTGNKILKQQLLAMKYYLTVLTERITKFNKRYDNFK